MIDAYFDTKADRQAAVSGVYQYDTGQRLRLRGLPSQREISGIDNYIDTIYDGQGNVIPEEERVAMVEAHYSRLGDMQAETRLAVWDIDNQLWTVDIPDEYLTIAEPVYVYVTVYHGEEILDGELKPSEEATPAAEDETDKEVRSRRRTVYEVVFTPIHRAAPSNVATDEQEQQWQNKQDDINEGLADAKTAEENAMRAAETAKKTIASLTEGTTATEEAEEAARIAQTALDAIEAADKSWSEAEIIAVELAPGSNATATTRVEGDKRTITLGIPKGEQGDAGAKGATGPADVTIELDTRGGTNALEIKMNT